MIILLKNEWDDRFYGCSFFIGYENIFDCFDFVFEQYVSISLVTCMVVLLAFC